MRPCLLAILLLCATAAQAQPRAKHPYTVPETQYKRIHQAALRAVMDRAPEYAIGQLRDYATRHPDDPDNWFAVAVTEAQMGNDRAAARAVRRALDAGLPPERFLAGPRDLLAPLLEIDSVRARLEGAGPLVGGPMLGRVTGHGAAVWVRTADEADVRARAYRRGRVEPVAESAVVRTRAARDYTAELELAGLSPDSEYRYEVLVNGEPAADALPMWLRTAPEVGGSSRFRVVFGGGAGYVPENEHMWNTIRAYRPDALLLLGDNVYSDDPGRPAMQQFCYYRRQLRPEWRALTAQTPVYAIWDDHDFGTNDCRGGPEVDWPPWKPRVWETFTQNWVNPPYASGGRPGGWFAWTIADVDFFFLDGRYYRTNPRWPAPSMLGAEQKQWLLEQLAASEAAFKVIVSPVPWAEGVKPGSLDTWDGFAAEREEIFRCVTANKVDGVLLLSADRHRSDAWRIPRAEGYDLYEFESSRLTNQHVHKTFEEAIFSYNELQSFAMLDFDTAADDPSVTHRIVNIRGDCVFEMELRLSQLSHR